jgi:hypothetical protein
MLIAALSFAALHAPLLLTPLALRRVGTAALVLLAGVGVVVIDILIRVSAVFIVLWRWSCSFGLANTIALTSPHCVFEAVAVVTAAGVPCGTEVSPVHLVHVHGMPVLLSE